jgi:hypothetical protein
VGNPELTQRGNPLLYLPVELPVLTNGSKAGARPITTLQTTETTTKNELGD